MMAAVCPMIVFALLGRDVKILSKVPVVIVAVLM
jgi:hypothetical protein